MIDVNCDRCKKPVDEPGALLFSPPKGQDVKKYHICVGCFDALVKHLQPKPVDGQEEMARYFQQG